jgi:hypothetical protein
MDSLFTFATFGAASTDDTKCIGQMIRFEARLGKTRAWKPGLQAF